MTIRKAHLAIGVCSLIFLTGMSPLLAQKDRRKKSFGVVPASARVSEAESYFTEGEKYFLLEDYAKSLYYFQRSLELNAGNNDGNVASIHYKVAEILSKGNKQEDLQKAAVSIGNALSIEKKNKYYYILASTIYSSMNNFSEAEKMLETMMDEVEGNEEYLYDLAALYQYDHKPDQAIRAYNRAESVLGINEVSSLQKQRLYFEEGKVNEAIAEGQKLINANPDEEHLVVAYAEILSQYKQGPKAIAVLEEFLKTHPASGSVRLMLAKMYHDAGQEQKFRDITMAVFDDGSVSVAEKVDLLGNQIAILAKDPGTNAADTDTESFIVRLFEKLSQTNPGENSVHAAGGDLYMLLKKNSLAEKEYIEAIGQGSSNFDVFQNLISLELQDNKFDSIIVHTETGLELFPNQAVLYYFNGYAQLRRRHYREAVTSLMQAKKLSAVNTGSPGDIDGMLGDAYNGLKDYPKSDKSYEDALALNPENDLILNNYSYFLAMRNENLEKAERMAAHLIKNNPGNPTYLDTYSWVLYMRGKYKDARKAIEKAIASGNGTAVFFDHYGDILYQLGSTDEAVKQWQKSKSMDSGNPLIDRKIENRKL